MINHTTTAPVAGVVAVLVFVVVAVVLKNIEIKYPAITSKGFFLLENHPFSG